MIKKIDAYVNTFASFRLNNVKIPESEELSEKVEESNQEDTSVQKVTTQKRKKNSECSKKNKYLKYILIKLFLKIIYLNIKWIFIYNFFNLI